MEQRLIDANAIFDKVEANYRMSEGVQHECEREFLNLICDAPTVDAVPVIRCSKCRMSFIADESMELYGAEIGKRYCSSGRKVSDDFYCADGERKDDER